MNPFIQFDPKKQPQCKIELHVHLDGALRPTTIWELAKKKKIDLKVDTLEDLIDSFCVKCPTTLADFLKPFSVFIPVVAGDGDAIERISYEFCEDSAKQGVLYSEPRICPHLYSSTHCPFPLPIQDSVLTPRDVILHVIKGLKRGAEKFNITFRIILCCFRLQPQWSNEILDLCQEFQKEGVVAIDVAGDEAVGLASPEIIAAFQRAEKLGIRRTAHAGEAGPAGNVLEALTTLHAERIGHGYHVVDDEKLYQDCVKKRVHFEACPYSSCLTGSVPLNERKHPIVRFAEDNANFSINRDDPTITQKTLDQEYNFLKGFGLKDVHIIRANFNAARNSFLPPQEKKLLLQKLMEIYGIFDNASHEYLAGDFSELNVCENAT